MIKRVVLIVLDSVGIGELPDAQLYGDVGSDTIGNISKKLGDRGLSLPNLEKLGLGNIDNGAHGIKAYNESIGCYGKAMEKSAGKDTTTGHWEIAGVILENAFPTYPNGFPKELLSKFENKIGTGTIGNTVASGTAIIEELGDEHVKTGYPIIYTSADSVFQIAAHEEIIPLEKLYEMCRTAREMLVGEHAVGRVIARPFIGESGNYKRTSNRRDFSLKPMGETILNHIKDSGMDVCAVGKIEDIYAGEGITDAVHIKNNMDGVDCTIKYMKQQNSGLVFTNLVDFDMLFGHRNDVNGYANALVEFDNRLPEIMENLRDDDVLIITADHGCDPTTPSTDHSREHIPVLCYGKELKQNINLGVRTSFSDIGKTILELLDIDKTLNGTSFAKEIKR
jgi:phosphopentomutase